jgi:hypothetical protein
VVLFNALVYPRTWPDTASALAAAIEGNGAPILSMIRPPVQLDKRVRAETESSVRAVVCTDAPPYETPIDQLAVLDHDLQEDVLTYQVTSHFAALQSFGCHHWKGRAKERFAGPFNSTLSNPILVIGNTVSAAMNPHTILTVILLQ